MADVNLRIRRVARCARAIPAAVFLYAGAAFAQTPAAPVSAVRISVDASDAVQHLLHSTMKFPVKPGPVSLLYPKWIPGEHGPTGPIEDVAGLRFTANGKPVSWRRDDVNMFEFHVDVPQGSPELDVSFDFTAPPGESGFSAGSSITPELAVLSWNQLLLYPDGLPVDQIRYQADLTIPQGWHYGTALPVDHEAGSHIFFRTAPLSMLIDSPVQTGVHYRTVDLNPGASIPTFLHIAADSDRATRISDEQIRHYRNLVKEANALFGAHHYNDYHFLYTLSDHVAHFGLEHHESSDNRADEQALTDENKAELGASLLPHEYVHSWNGKYRRPIGLVTPDYNAPMKGGLLWVYEGLTEYLGAILAPRSGLLTADQFLDQLASDASRLDRQTGRTWRPLEDTAVAAQVLYDAPDYYSDLRRSTDFYEEGALIWLDVDVTIRTLSHGTKSLDDFCKAWAGPPSTPPAVKPYDFDDLVRTLNSVQPYDWASFLEDKLKSLAPRAPLGGITDGGYKLTYTAEPSEYTRTWEEERKTVLLTASLGLSVTDSGRVVDVLLNTPAFRAGLAPAVVIVAVNGRAFSASVIRNAISDAAKSGAPITLIVRDKDFYKTLSIDYHGGLKYPHLVRDKSKPDLISEIIRPRVTAPAPSTAPGASQTSDR